jgi:protein-tyrosine phosphatase
MRFGVFFLLVVGLLAHLGYRLESPLRWALAWPALSFALVGLAYLLGRGEIFGKRETGRVPAWSLLLHAPYLVLTRGIWILQQALGREDPANEVAPGVWVGRRPSPSDLPPECGLVVDLTCEFPVHAGVARQVDYLGLPTLDGTAPSEASLRRVAELASDTRVVLFNCAAGHGRSATAAAALLLTRGTASSVEEAVGLMKAARPGIGLNRAQRAALRPFVTVREPAT